MVVTAIITTTHIPQYVVENTEMDLSMIVSAVGGTIVNPTFAISHNSGSIAKFFDGYVWSDLSPSFWTWGYLPETTIVDGQSITFTGYKLKFPSVLQNSECAIDFVPGYFNGSSNIHNGPIVTKSTMVINQEAPPDNMLYYILGAIGVAVAAVVGFTLLRRKT